MKRIPDTSTLRGAGERASDPLGAAFLIYQKRIAALARSSRSKKLETLRLAFDRSCGVRMALCALAAITAIRAAGQPGGIAYRLVSPQSGSELAATESVAPDRSSAVVFEFLHSQQMRFPAPALFPEGLEPEAVYNVRPIYGHLAAGAPTQASGSYWMGRGIDAVLQGDYDSAAFVFERKR